MRVEKGKARDRREGEEKKEEKVGGLHWKEKTEEEKKTPQ